MWKNKRDISNLNYNPYTLNLFYSTIKIKLANLIFQKPAFILNPRPGNAQWNQDFATQSANIKQDILNTIVQNPNANFPKILRRAARDSFTRFGVVEVGYAADWRNPQKEEQVFDDHGEDERDEKARVVDDNLVPLSERFYFKRINPKRFRVSVSDAMDLNDHEWVGYYDFYYTRNLRKTKGIKFPESYKNTSVSADYTNLGHYSGAEEGKKPEFLRLLAEGEISKVWHIWDMVEKKRLLILDDCFDSIWETDCDRLPFRDLRWDERLEGFYPMPPAFQWLSPQDDINEAREQYRSHRRRFVRKFYSLGPDFIDPLEKEKFTTGGDGVVIEFKKPEAIGPIANSEVTQTTGQDLLIAKDDFNIVSGTSAEARGQNSDRETATSAKINAARAQIRESAEQMDFSLWISSIGRETLVQAREYLVEGLWIKWSTNPDEQTALTEVQMNGPIYKFVTSQHIDDGYDFDVDVDVMNQTPAAMESQRQSFVGFLTLVHNFPEIAMSPVLIRKAAITSGMRDEKVIHQMQQVALLAMAAKASQAANQQGQSLSQASGAAGQPVLAKQMETPGVEAIDQQIQQQLQ